MRDGPVLVPSMPGSEITHWHLPPTQVFDSAHRSAESLDRARGAPLIISLSARECVK